VHEQAVAVGRCITFGARMKAFTPRLRQAASSRLAFPGWPLCGGTPSGKSGDQFFPFMALLGWRSSSEADMERRVRSQLALTVSGMECCAPAPFATRLCIGGILLGLDRGEVGVRLAASDLRHRSAASAAAGQAR